MALRNCLSLGTGASSHRRQQPSPHPLCRPLSRCVRGRESCRTHRKLQLRGRRRCRRNRSSNSNSSSSNKSLPSSKAALAITPGSRLEDWNAVIVPSEQFVCLVCCSAHVGSRRSWRCRRAVALPDARFVVRVARQVQFNLVSAAK